MSLLLFKNSLPVMVDRESLPLPRAMLRMMHAVGTEQKRCATNGENGTLNCPFTFAAELAAFVERGVA